MEDYMDVQLIRGIEHQPKEAVQLLGYCVLLSTRIESGQQPEKCCSEGPLVDFERGEKTS
jgi:hypothetical protein